MVYFRLILHVLALISFGHCRFLWSADLPEISKVTLEKGKPIQPKQSYTKLQICDVNGTIFSDTLSQLYNLTELKICRSNIENIEDGALCSSPTLRVLELNFYDTFKAPLLTKSTFKNCNNLEELLLLFGEKNDTLRINSDAIEDLPNLKELHIYGYKLPHLQKNFLNYPNKLLTTLALSACGIETIDSDAFSNLSNLEEVNIMFNQKLKTLPMELFKSTPNLKKLMLRRNALGNLTWDEFKDLHQLEELNLAENNIVSFDAEKIAKNMPNLKTLSIELNPPTCKQREAFVNELKKKLSNIDVIYKFDPGYYDSCEEEI